MMPRSLLLPLGLLLAALALPVQAQTSFLVTSTADPGDGTCDAAGTGDGCTLREAIAASNALQGVDQITFTAGLSGTITLVGGRLQIADHLTISGPGAEVLAVSGNHTSGVFGVGITGTHPGLVVNVSGLTIQDGNDNFGGGIQSSRGLVTVADCIIRDNVANASGGGIYSFYGSLTVTGSTLRDNTVGGDESEMHVTGGGLSGIASTLTVTGSTLSNNTARSRNAADGGGLFQQGTNLVGDEETTLTVTGSTISGNTSVDLEPGIPSPALDLSYGGGLYIRNSAATLTSNTISGNTANYGPGIFLVDDQEPDGGGPRLVSITHTTITGNATPYSNTYQAGGLRSFADYARIVFSGALIAGNAPLDIVGSSGFESSGYNVVGSGDVGAFTGPGDLTGITEPHLGPLADNGGPTLTHILFRGSPALERGGTCGPTDQRGLPAPLDGDDDGSALCDAGSVEVAEPTLPSFTVTNTDDLGPGSLRQALLAANADPDANTIVFAIPGTQDHDIRPATPLPVITAPVEIDGFFQPGSAPCGDDGTPGIPTVRLQGTDAGAGASGLVFQGTDGSSVRGLVIVGFGGDGIRIDGGTSSIVACNLVGVFPDDTALGNGIGIHVTGGATINAIGGSSVENRNVISSNTNEGVLIDGGSSITFVGSNRIGTTADGTAARGNGTGIRLGTDTAYTLVGVGLFDSPAPNLVSGNTGVGVLLDGADSNTVSANLIGTAADGLTALPNGFHGVVVLGGASGNRIGVPGQGNTIAGNGLWGVIVEGAGTTGNTLQGNRIGTALDGTTLVGNGRDGVLIYDDADGNTVGGINAAEGNTIAGNAESGVVVLGTPSTQANRITRNRMSSNGGLGIDLGGDGFTANDPTDADAGPNRLQNFPEITTADSDGSMITLSYRVPSAPANAAYPLRIDVSLADADGQEGGLPLFTDTYTEADYDGCGSPPCDKTATFAQGGLSGDEQLVATATTADGNTSEYAPAVSLGGEDQLVILTLTPTNPAPPVEVMRGQRFRFDATTTVAEGGPTSLEYWSVLRLPNGEIYYRPVLGPVTVQLTPGTTATANIGQRVRRNSPYGTYTYIMMNGTYPDDVVAADSFQVTVVPNARLAGSASTEEVAEGASGRRAEMEAWLAYDAEGNLLEAGSVLALHLVAQDGILNDDTTAPTASSATLPEAFALHVAFPNPFATDATVRFDLPEAATVRLTVYDVLGREVARLVDGPVGAGTHTAVLDGRALPAGTYLVRLTTEGGFTQTQRITRVR